jgi:hypothetical protein
LGGKRLDALHVEILDKKVKVSWLVHHTNKLRSVRFSAALFRRNRNVRYRNLGAET